MTGRSTQPERRWRLVRASRDAIPPSVRRFMRRARRRRVRAVAPWAAVAGVAALLGGLGWLVFVSPVFGVRQVEVVGAVVADPDEVRRVAAVRDGEPLAAVDVGVIVARVEALAPVRHVEVDRSWPSTLVIVVTERTPVLAVPGDTGFALVDEAGVVFRSAASPPPGVVTVELANPGPDDPSTRSALRVVDALPAVLVDLLDRLVVQAPARIRLELVDGRTVVWGDAEQSEVKAKVATALLDRAESRIDVSAPDVVTIS